MKQLICMIKGHNWDCLTFDLGMSDYSIVILNAKCHRCGITARLDLTYSRIQKMLDTLAARRR